MLYNGAVLAEVFRAGINAVPGPDARRRTAIGMRKTQVMRIVLMPQAVRFMLPAIISQCVVVLKDTSLGFVVDLPRAARARARASREFVDNSLITYLLIAVIYITMNSLVSALADLARAAAVPRGGTQPPRSRSAADRGGRLAGLSSALRRLLGHPEPDHALDDDGAVLADAAHPHRHVGVVPGPLLGVGLGDAGDVAGGLGGVAPPPCPWGSSACRAGTVASASAPIAASRPLQIAITCTVPMWFCTPRRLRIVSSA